MASMVGLWSSHAQQQTVKDLLTVSVPVPVPVPDGVCLKEAATLSLFWHLCGTVDT